jgi:cysteine desulfurase
MLANNEVGTIQPVSEIARHAREQGTLVHTDAVQAPGKIRVDVRELGVDLLSISGHKFNGPKGIGALFVKEGTKLDSLVLGGAHERGRRAGTENVAGIVGLGKACEIVGSDKDHPVRMRALRDRLENRITSEIADTRVNGHPEHRLPNTSSISFEGVKSDSLLMNLDLEGIAVSAGSACHSGAHEPSHVLTAMGISHENAAATIRFSVGRGTTEEDIDRTLNVLQVHVERLRGG